jgi:hypothetical protein
MLRTVIIVLLVFLKTFFVFSQQVLLSNEETFLSGDTRELLGKLGERILVFNQQGSLRYELEIYNDKLQLLKTRELLFEKQKVDILAALPTGDQFILLYSLFHKLDKLNYIRKYNADGDLLDSMKISEEGNVLDYGYYEPVQSKNEQFLLLARQTTYYSLEMALLDLKNFQVVWFEEKDFPDYMLERDLADISVRDNGEVYLVFEKNNFGWQKAKHFHHIFIILPDNKEMSNLKVPFNGRLTADFSLVFDQKNDKVIVAGLYAERSFEDAAGHFVYSLRNGLLEKEIVYTPFSLKLLKSNQTSKRKIKKELSDLHMVDVIVKNDGGLLILAEIRKELTRESARHRYTDYYYEDIFLICTRPDGSLFWNEQIRKYQLSYDDDAKYSSYFLFSTPSLVRLIFNDEIKNENTISEFAFSPLGIGKRKSLFSTDLHRLRLMFSKAIQVSPESFIVPSMADGKYRLVMVSY